MVDYALGDTYQFPATCTQSPAQVYLFHVGKEPSIQSAGFAVILQTDEQGGTGSPEYGSDGIVLTLVGLDCPHDAPSAEGVTVLVDVSAGGSSVFEQVFLPQTPDFRLAARYFGVGVHVLGQQGKPVFGDFDVGVQQDDVFSLHLLQGLVVTVGKTVVAVQRDEADGGKFAAYRLNGIVRRSIVGHIDCGSVGLGIGHNGGQVGTEHPASVPVQNDDCYFLIHVV